MLKITNKQTKKTTTEFGKDAELRISSNLTAIRDNHVSGHRLESGRRSESIIYIKTAIPSISLYLSIENKLHHGEQIISINLWFWELFFNFVDIFLSKDFIQ